MRRFVFGVCVGLLLGTVTAGLADSNFWFNGKDLDGADQAVKNGYAAGMYDATAYWADELHVLAQSHPSDTSIATLDKAFAESMDCLDSKGDKLGDFTTWAATQWAGKSDDSAAAIVIDGCN